jgi:hypothetical protein
MSERMTSEYALCKQGLLVATSRIAKLERQRDAAVEALTKIVELGRLPDENAMDCFERVAALFCAETGYLAPGKDCRVHDMRTRTEAWDTWYSGRVNTARAVLAEIEGKS